MMSRPGMRVARAGEVQSALEAQGLARRSGGGVWHAAAGICHGSTDRDSHSLHYRDSDRAGGSLTVRCHSAGCEPNAIRHALQAATGLTLCRCDACWQAWRHNHGPPVNAAKFAVSAAASQQNPTDSTHTRSRAPGCSEQRISRREWTPDSACALTCDGGRAIHLRPLSNGAFPYLALTCDCGECSYDTLHKRVAAAAERRGARWRQDAAYTMADGHTRIKTRLDPHGPKGRWRGQTGSLAGMRPLAWAQGPEAVILVEGEKAAAAIASVSALVERYTVLSIGGAGGADSIDLGMVLGRPVIIWPDLDTPGITAGRQLLRRIGLAALDGAPQVLFADTCGLPEHADPADCTPRSIEYRIATAMLDIPSLETADDE